MSKSLRVAVIDDHPLFRDGVINTLKHVGGIDVVGQGATAAEALKIAEEHTPDVVLLDVCLPGGGVEAAASISRACPDVRTIMLTASEDEQHVASALRAGAQGYLLKGSSGQELVETLRVVGEGGLYVAPNLAARVLIKQSKKVEAIVDHPGLTRRQEETLALVARGMSNKEIARIFKCTERTIKHHMTSLMQKLNVRNRVEAALKFKPERSRVSLDVVRGPALGSRAPAW